MSDIFISYARADRSKVEPLAKALEAKGWSVWWDTRIRSGTPFDRVIEQALDESRCVVVVWSQNSVESDWVRLEATEGLERNILISVAIEPNLKLPLRFRYIHTEPLIDRDKGKNSPTFDKIVSDLSAILESPEANKKPAGNQRVHHDLDAMVEVPTGEFIYQNGKATIEKPFTIDVYPVTNQQYEKFIKAGGYRNEQLWSGEGLEWLTKKSSPKPTLWHDHKWNQPDHPVVGVNYFEAEAFARWAEKRLPTEIEWERAARGTDGRTYPWGNEFDTGLCNTKDAKIEKTTHVTRYSNGISPVSCYDMAGNVLEWTDSWIDDKKLHRKLRGGSWKFDRFYARCTSPYRYNPDTRNNFIGFRCARTK